MLVLSRKTKEQIVIPNRGITLTVVEIRGNKVRIGIDAPDSEPVHRAEVWASIQRGDPKPENKQLDRAEGQQVVT